MNIDYKKKYLKYKNKYLLSKVQYGGNEITPEQYKIILELLKLFLNGFPKTLLENGDILNNIINIYIKEKETTLTKKKLNLLIIYFYGKGEIPNGLKKFSLSRVHPTENDKSENAEVIKKIIEKEEKQQKNLFYYNLLCTIFDDSVNIDKFKELANKQVISISYEKMLILNKLEVIFSIGIPEELRDGKGVVNNIMSNYINQYETYLTRSKINLLYLWFIGIVSPPNGLKTITEPDFKKKKEKFFRILLYTIFNDLVDMDKFNELAKEQITFP